MQTGTTDESSLRRLAKNVIAQHALLISLLLSLVFVGETGQLFAVSLFIGEILIAALTSPSSAIPQLVAKDPLYKAIPIGSGLLLFAASIWWAALHSSTKGVALGWTQEWQASLTFATIGAIIGALLRQSIGHFVFSLVLGRANRSLDVRILAVFLIAAAAFPLAPPHSALAPIYALGLIAGFSIQGIRRRKSRRLARYRRHIELLLSASHTPEDHEKKALRLLKEDRHNKLLEYIGGLPHAQLTTTLRTLRCLVWRMRHRYDTANNDTQPPVGVGGNSSDEEGLHLQLLHALNCAELGEEAKADEIIDRLHGTPQGASCAALNTTKALRMAERVLDRLEPWSSIRCNHVSRVVTESINGESEHRLPLKAVNDAQLLYAKSRYEAKRTFGEGAIVMGLPFSSAFVRDAAGAALLAAGLYDSAKLNLDRCVDGDPDYSAAYLHLGDYFLLSIREAQRTIEEDRQREALWRARVCYETARRLEGRGELQSRVQARAQRRLDLLAEARQMYAEDQERTIDIRPVEPVERTSAPRIESDTIKVGSETKA